MHKQYLGTRPYKFDCMKSGLGRVKPFDYACTLNIMII
jgi:hypothetical protein